MLDAARLLHREWGGDARLDDYVDSMRKSTLTVAGMVVDNELACVLTHRPTPLMLGDHELLATGIKTVVTAPTHRGRDLARALVQHVMDDTTTTATFLFSDIGTDFYRALGFTPLSHVAWSAKTDALPARPSRLQPCSEPTSLLQIFDASWKGAWLHAQRSASSWSSQQTGDAFLIGDADYVVARIVREVLWIDDLATNTLSVHNTWSALRQLASMLGAQHVSGWLRPEHAGGPFVATQRTKCIPMIHADVGDVRSHFAPVDRF